MTQRLTDMEITRVSLVDKGANARVMAILKRNEEGPMGEPFVMPPPAGALNWIRKQLGLDYDLAEPVAKAQTFAAVIAGQTLQDALDDAFWTLRDVLWSAIYATDENGQAEPLATKRALVEQDLSEFTTYLLGRMDDGIEKRDASAAARDRAAIEAVVAKVGKKISGSRLERLQSAAASLTSVLDEVAEVVEEAAETAEEVPVDKAELIAAVTEANEPIIKRLDALEATKVEKAAGGEGDAGESDELTLEGIATAVEKLADTVADLAASQGVRKSLAGQDGGEDAVKKGGAFAGILS